MAEPIRLAVPGSKSHTQRALVLAALADQESVLRRPAGCDDSDCLVQALEDLGVSIHRERDAWRVRGGRLVPPAAPLWCGDAGTAVRFLAPLALVAQGPLVLDGSHGLRARPLLPLLDALVALGIQVDYLGDPGRLPVRLTRVREPGPLVPVDASQSSQFASGLLMVAPCLPQGLTVQLLGEPVSRPYLDMTLEVMGAFGVHAAAGARQFVVPAGRYHSRELDVEPDWSAAAFLFAAGWILGRSVDVVDLPEESLQGDRVIIDFLTELDFPRPHRFDLQDCPDLLAPLAVACAFAGHPSQLRQVGHARVKESDRLHVLAHALRSTGVSVAELPDGLEIQPAQQVLPATLAPRGDHRMAMAFGLLQLRQPGVQVLDPGCVSKSFPGFWAQLEKLR